ncbi:MAG: hypothetical protein EOM24_02680 [Chloroflexia bacterium]|nr:hypothetical protein [Chloroflexia bacterium]
MALAEATGRQFTMLWPRTEACSAAFEELFALPWPVHTVTIREIEALDHWDQHKRRTLDLLTADSADICLQTWNWLLVPSSFPAHRSLKVRCAQLLASMQPTAAIQARINAFRDNNFRPQMIGVHLRRADMRFLYPTSVTNTTSAMAAVDTYLDCSPDAGVLLCTDDGAVNQNSGLSLAAEGVRATFVQRYGARIVYTNPRSLDRREPAAIQDALVDLWLLRDIDYLVGTAASSFSEMAALGRSIPVTMCRSEHPLRHAIPLRGWLHGQYSFRRLVSYYWSLIRPRGVR